MTSGNHLTYTERKLRNEQFSNGFLWCAACKQFKPINNFWKSKYNTNYGFRCYCRDCEENRRNKKRDSENAKIRNRELKQIFVELSGGKCHRCGYDTFNSSLDFHHIYRTKKKYNPGLIIYSGNMEATWKELDKCCLLCRNCHAAYEAGDWRAEFIKRDGLGWTIGDDLSLDDDRYNHKQEIIEYTPLPIEYIESLTKQLTFFENNDNLT